MTNTMVLNVNAQVSNTVFSERDSWINTEINKYPPFTRDEEIAVAKRINEGDESAVEYFLKHNLRFIYSCASKYVGNGVPLCDLYQVAKIGALKAIHDYTKYEEFKFSSFAVYYIRKEIIDTIINEGLEVRITYDTRKSITKIDKFISSFEVKYGYTPCEFEIAEGLGMDEKDVTTILSSRNTMSSIDVKFDSDDDNSSSYGDTLSGSLNADKDVNESDRLNQIKMYMSVLSNRDKEIISMYFGLDGHGECGIDVISDEVGLTTVRVGQIIKESIKKMHNAANI